MIIMTKKVLYMGDLSPMNISLPVGRIEGWKRGETRELPDFCANKVVSESCYFTIVEDKVITEKVRLKKTI